MNVKDELIDRLIDLAFAEDIGDGDHTTLSTIPAEAMGKNMLLIKEDGVLAGVEMAKRIFARFDENLQVEVLIEDGAEVKKGDIAMYVTGSVRSLLQTERLMLNVELKKRKIRMMAVCPGWVKTEFFDHAVTDDTITYYNKFYTPEQVITRALKDMKRGRDVSICGFQVRAQVFLTKLLPHRLIMKIWCKQQKK